MRDEEQRVSALEAELTDEERTMLDKLADGIVKRRITPLALFFLESMKPLGFVGSQLMLFFRPIISIIWPSPVAYDQVVAILERRGSIELLLRRLEARADGPPESTTSQDTDSVGDSAGDPSPDSTLEKDV